MCTPWGNTDLELANLKVETLESAVREKDKTIQFLNDEIAKHSKLRTDLKRLQRDNEKLREAYYTMKKGLFLAHI